MVLPQGFLETLHRLEINETSRLLIVCVSTQKLILFEKETEKASYQVSTARNGIGQEVNSFQTPLGLHRIKEKIGKNTPLGAVFESRVFYGTIWYPASEQSQKDKSLDLITSRVLWLEGLEPGLNSGNNSSGVLIDSYQRYIYIHGTNHEHELGSPVSRGCIRMLNTEVIALFDQVEEGDLVWIGE